MKICIATFYNITHPGAVLQACALSRTLEHMGHEASIVQYPIQSARNPSMNTVYSALTKVPQKQRAYRRFVTEYLRETRAYRTVEELVADPPEADAYICGSDQIWNPRVTGGRPDPAYYLSFGEPSVRRIAYAPSFGGESISPEHQMAMKEYLQRFDALSSREMEGCEFVQNLTGRPAELVLDPTLLRDDWAELARPRQSKGSYVLIYQLQKSPGIYAAATSLARKLGKPLLNIDASLKLWTRPGKCVRPLDPAEWLGLIHNAAAVVTNSFHGTAFSILFKRPFYAVALTGHKARHFVRMKNLCGGLGLQERCVQGAEDHLGGADIDWDAVELRKNALRKSSFSFLERALMAG